MAVNQKWLSKELHRLKQINRCIAKPAVSLILVITMLLLQVSFPVAEVGAQGFVVTTPMVSAGNQHSLALKSDGTVWAWGSNWGGQLGDGTTNRSLTPIQVTALTDVQAISAGGWHSLALMEDGTVWAWGANRRGQLGDGSTSDKHTPVRVSGLTNVQAISAGAMHSLALKEDGTVWAWGANWTGQLGDGTGGNRDDYSSFPVQVIGLTNVQAISAGDGHSLAIKVDGTNWAWGWNDSGQLGDGTKEDKNTPVQITSLMELQTISAGGLHSSALKGDRTVWAWGGNWFGQLGDGTTNSSDTPVQVKGLTNVQAISAGGFADIQDHSLALKDDGTVWAWGGNEYGQIGDGTTNSNDTPVQLSSLTNVQAISAGGLHSLALKEDGTVWAWGQGDTGQLGDGTTDNSNTPVRSLINLYQSTFLPGVWSGHYTATQGETSLELTIMEDNGAYSAIFAFGPLETNPTVPEGSFYMDVYFNPNTLEIQLIGREWIIRPSDYYMVDLIGSVSADFKQMSGDVLWSSVDTPPSGQPGDKIGEFWLEKLDGPKLGTHRVAYIPVKYQDGPQPERTVEDLKVRAKLVEDYFHQQSYGQVKIQSEFKFEDWGILDLSVPRRYDANWACDVIDAAIELANINDVSDYDAIVVIQTAFDRAFCKPVGTSMTNMVFLTDRHSFGTWAHELGHAMFKWYDYYGRLSTLENYYWSRGQIHYWGIMGKGDKLDYPAPVMTYNKVLAGWLRDDEPMKKLVGAFGLHRSYPVQYLMDMEFADQIVFYETEEPSELTYYFEGRRPPDNTELTDPWVSSSKALEEDVGILIYEKEVVTRQLRYGSGLRTRLYPLTAPHVYIVNPWLRRNRVTLTPGEYFECDISDTKFRARKVDSQLYLDISEHIPEYRRVMKTTTSIIPAPNLWDQGLDAYASVMDSTFDIDLMMFTSDGLKVGMDYIADEYVMEIPGARTIGNIGGAGPEWISVPDDIEVYYEINTTPMENWYLELVEREMIEDDDLIHFNREIEVIVQEVLIGGGGERTITEEVITGSAPILPTNPLPLDGATGVDLAVDLQWKSGDPDPNDQVTYRLYLGTEDNPPLIETLEPLPGDQSTITFNLDILEPNTTYYWRVGARDDHGFAVDGPVWSFTTGSEMPDPGDVSVVIDTNDPLIIEAGSGDTVTFTAEAKNALGNLITDDVEDFAWVNADAGVFEEAEYGWGTYDVTATYEDVSSNTITVTVQDTIKPTITIDGTTYSDGDEVYLGYIATGYDKTVEYIKEDCGSGFAPGGDLSVNDSVSIPTGEAGFDQEYQLTVTDRAGNVATITFTYHVLSLDDLINLLEPVSEEENRFRRNRTVPLKLQIYEDGEAAQMSADDLTFELKLYQINNGVRSEREVQSTRHQGDLDEAEFRLSEDGYQYIFNLSLRGLQTGEYELDIHIKDGDGIVGTIEFEIW